MHHGITARSVLRGHVWAQLLSQAAGQIWLVRWFWQGISLYQTTPEIFIALSSQIVFTNEYSLLFAPPNVLTLSNKPVSYMA